MPDPRTCAECGHDVRAEGRVSMWVSRFWRLPPRCQATVLDESGWGAHCGCTATTHAR